jgi:autotransporter-associated beta strand protein
MFFTWYHQSKNRKSLTSPRHRQSVAKCHSFCRPQLEPLEQRLAPAVHQWTGSTSSLWSDTRNWINGSPAGDPAADLVFPTVSNRASRNDLSGLAVHALTFSANGFTISGNPLRLSGGISDQVSGTTVGSNNLLLDLTLTAAQTFSVTQGRSESLYVNGAINLNGNTLTLDGDGFVLSLGSTVSGAGGLVKNGRVEGVLASANSYTGPTTVNAGALYIGNGNALGSTSAGTTVAGGASLVLYGAISVATPLTLVPGAVLADTGPDNRWTGPITLNGQAGIASNSGVTLTVSGLISGSGGLSHDGGGVLVLARNNTYRGPTFIFSGTLRQSVNYAVPVTSQLTVQSGATFDTNGTFAYIGSLQGAGTVRLANNGLNIGSDNRSTTFSGTITGPGAVLKDGTGTFTLTGRNNYDGYTDVGAGTLQLGVEGALPLTALTVIPGARLDLGGFNQTIGSLAGAGSVALGNRYLTTGGDNTSTTFSGTISGSGLSGLGKVGSGSLTLSGNNSYQGITSVVSGTLLIDGSAPNSAIFVYSGAVLGGSGTASGVLVLGTISPGGADPGILTSSIVSFVGGSTFRVRLNGTLAGSGYDQLSVAGLIGLNDSPTLDLSLGFASAVGDTFVILSGSGGIPGTFNGLPDGAVFGVAGGAFRINYTANTVVLTHVPSPTDHFLVAAPANAAAGSPFDVTVTALDPQGNRDPSYTGTVSFTSSDTAPGVVLPAAYTFTAADAGVHTFTDTGLGETTLVTLGDQTLSVTDMAGDISGMATITVTSGAARPSDRYPGPAAAMASRDIPDQFSSYSRLQLQKRTPPAFEAGAVARVDQLFATLPEEGHHTGRLRWPYEVFPLRQDLFGYERAADISLVEQVFLSLPEA